MSLSDQSQQWCPTSVQVTALQARSLRIKGKNGTNDAYAIMQVAKDKFATSVAERSVAPVWNEEATFELPLFHNGNTEKCTLHVHVMHRALVGPDKLLGQAVINLLELSEVKSRNKTEWHKLLDKAGKPDKDRGEVRVDIQFMKNNMTASMFDLSATDKPRSRLGKFKDKVRGKKQGLSDSASAVVPSFTQVLMDSEGEGEGEGEVEGEGEGERGADKEGKKKKNKLKSLFSPKSNLQRHGLSQSMSVLGPLPEKNSSLSGSRTTGLNVDFSEGKNKFKFLTHMRTGSSLSLGHSRIPAPLAEQSNLCINGTHMYTEEPQPRSVRIGSNFSLASSGHGSMEDLRRAQDRKSSGTSMDSFRALKQSSLWAEEEEEERVKMDEKRKRKEEQESKKLDEEERMRKEEQEKRRITEEEEEEEEIRLEEEQEERRLKVEGEERVWKEDQEKRRLEEKRREEEERIKEEGELIKREEHERMKREDRLRKEDERKMRAVEERLEREKDERVKEEEERIRREEEEEEEDMQRREEEKGRREEEERLRREEEDILRTMREEEEEERMKREEDRLRKEVEERRRIEEEERMKREAEKEGMKREAEKERMKREEERRRIEEEEERMKREAEEERMKREAEEERMKREAAEEERMKREAAEEERMKREAEEERMKREAEEERMKREAEEERMKREAEEERMKREAEEERMKREAEEERMKREAEEERMKREAEKERMKRAAEERMKREEDEEERRRIEEEEESMKREAEEERMKREEDEEERRRIEEEEESMKREAEEERMKREEERRRIEEEEERMKRGAEEERMKREEDRLRKEEEEEEMKRIEEEEQRMKREEDRLRKEERRIKEEEERVRKAAEEDRLRDKMGIKRREEEDRLKKKEEERKIREEEERLRREEEYDMRRKEEEQRKEEERRMELEQVMLRKEEAERRRLEEEESGRGEERRRDEEQRRELIGVKERFRVEEENMKKEELRGQEEKMTEREKKRNAQMEEKRRHEEVRGKLEEVEQQMEQNRGAEVIVCNNPFDEVSPTTSLDDTSSNNPFEETPTTSSTGPISCRTNKVSAVKPRSSSWGNPSQPSVSSNPFLSSLSLKMESSMDSPRGDGETRGAQDPSTDLMEKKDAASLHPNNQRWARMDNWPSKGNAHSATANLAQTKTTKPPPPPRRQSSTSLVGSGDDHESVSNQDHSSIRMDKGPVPLAPDRPSQAPSQTQRDQSMNRVNLGHKDRVGASISKVSQRVVQMITPLRSSSTVTTEHTSGGQSSTRSGNQAEQHMPSSTGGLRVAKHNKGPAPSRPRYPPGKTMPKADVLDNQLNTEEHDSSVEFDLNNPFAEDCRMEKSSGCGEEQRLTGEHQESLDSHDHQSCTSTEADPGSMQNSVVGDTMELPTPDVLLSEDGSCPIKSTSAKQVCAPLPPLKTTSTSREEDTGQQSSVKLQSPGASTSSELSSGISGQTQNYSVGGALACVTIAQPPCVPSTAPSFLPQPKPLKGSGGRSDWPPQATSSVPSQRNLIHAGGVSIAEQCSGEEAGGRGDRPTSSTRRPHPVKPLSSLENQPASNIQEGKAGKTTGILCVLQGKIKVKDTGVKGQYSQLSQEELISLVVKQQDQLSKRDDKIKELEKYIDNLLVRIIEEQPSILMSMNSLK